MKQVFFAVALCVGLASAGSAFAERWVTPVNGSVSAVTMPDGAVMMKVKIPAAEFLIISRDMKKAPPVCKVQEIYPGATDTMILVCQ